MSNREVIEQAKQLIKQNKFNEAENILSKIDDKYAIFEIAKIKLIQGNDNEAEKLYNYLLENNVQAILDDRENLSIGNRINDVYVLGTPKMIILGNQFDGTNYTIEDTNTNDKTTVNIENILNELE